MTFVYTGGPSQGLAETSPNTKTESNNNKVAAAGFEPEAKRLYNHHTFKATIYPTEPVKRYHISTLIKPGTFLLTCYWHNNNL
jgi:hypothetical protein